MKGIKSARRQEQMFGLVRECLAGDKSVRRFCLDRKMSCTTFGYWMRKYKNLRNDTKLGDSFIPLQVVSDLEKISEKLEITYPNGVEIKLPLSTEPGLLKTLIKIY